ncbi:iron complex transport system ATP-binding protein [Scopulibacillus daqui]|uniref:Iron complex transport system ATP-binding protein n=1 Tax=Scopulibacillus daqui TaxID=1469162 RepID=A0ABS2PXL2_9BACL|nr:ABC transporter ATP-binding protein [Scopulibacillus daqui]MBM7644616.1 iron complex transport system ATP-binding protein [Scopulibacillus daqui]
MTVSARKVSIGYGDQLIIKDLSLEIRKGAITTIIGPNGCGKSTLLKTIARVQQPKDGAIYLDGKAIHKEPKKEIAKRMAILPQNPEAPNGLTVRELVSYGRFPHQRGFGRLKKEDKDAVDRALSMTNTLDFAEKPVESLSGGQRQRAWIAMALAQETDLLILDEPTTFLDMAHQLDILKLLKQLNIEEQRTIVMVIHDLNLAARFSDYMIAMNSGTLIAEGTYRDIMTKDTLRKVFDIDAYIVNDPQYHRPVCLTYDTAGDHQEFKRNVSV